MTKKELEKEIQHLRTQIKDMENYISENAKLETEMWNNEGLMSRAVDAVNLGLWEWQIKSGNFSCNVNCPELFGYTAVEMNHSVHSWEDIVHTQDRKKLYKKLREYPKNGEAVYDCEARILCKSGDWKWIIASGKVTEKDKNGNPLIATGIIKDFSFRKEIENSIVTMTMHDKLTGLPNLFLLGEHFQHEKDNAKRYKYKLALMAGNLNDLDIISRNFGTDAVRNLLLVFGERITNTLRKSDIVAKKNECEFWFLIPGIKEKENENVVVSKILKECSQPFIFDGGKYLMTMGMGLTTYPDDGEEFGSLINNARIAMAKAKNEHHNSFYDFADIIGES